MWYQSFKPTSKDLFFRSEKTGDPRFGEISQPVTDKELVPESYILAGYPDDEGIALNQGRPGARLAPDAIRSRFYKTTKSQFHDSNLSLFDVGNLNTEISL